MIVALKRSGVLSNKSGGMKTLVHISFPEQYAAGHAVKLSVTENRTHGLRQDMPRKYRFEQDSSTEQEQRLRSARAVSLFTLVFSIFVSALVYFKNENLDISDYLLIFLSPLGLSLIAYFVVLHNDPESSD